jgi:hypothetical protein
MEMIRSQDIMLRDWTFKEKDNKGYVEGQAILEFCPEKKRVVEPPAFQNFGML